MCQRGGSTMGKDLYGVNATHGLNTQLLGQYLRTKKYSPLLSLFSRPLFEAEVLVITVINPTGLYDMPILIFNASHQSDLSHKNYIDRDSQTVRH